MFKLLDWVLFENGDITWPVCTVTQAYLFFFSTRLSSATNAIDIGFKQGMRNWHDNYEVNVDCLIVVGVITWHWKEVYDAV